MQSPNVNFLKIIISADAVHECKSVYSDTGYFRSAKFINEQTNYNEMRKYI